MIITSFTEDLYNAYAKEFIKTFDQHCKEKLVVYYEGGTNPLPKELEGRAEPYHEVPGIKEWFEAISRFPLMSGHLNGEYNINFDAGMVRKSLMQMHAARTYKTKVFWVDADVYWHSDVPKEFFDEVLPDDKISCYLGRNWAYTESGFLGFNYNEGCEKFFQYYQFCFQSGAIFAQPGWHDCYGYDWARKSFGHPELFNDLAAGLDQKSRGGKCHHPFINSVLGKYMDHRKGHRKKARSTASDLISPRTEAYWQRT